MGLPAGHLSDPAIDTGFLAGSSGDRGARLKAAGNGVVPQQSAAAVLICIARFCALAPRTSPTSDVGAAQQAPDESRTCKACGESKPLEAFGWNTTKGVRARRGVCKACHKAGRKAAK